MARKIEDQYTTTAQQDLTRSLYGDDDAELITFECGKCGGAGRIEAYSHVDGGICYGCDGRPERARTRVSVARLMQRAKGRDATAARIARKAAAASEALSTWQAANADLLERAAALGIEWPDSWTYVPSPAQEAKLKAIVAEREQRAAVEAERRATALPVPTGRTIITGTVTSWKLVPDNYSYHGGDILKMVVQDARGFKLYGTCPQSLQDLAYASWTGTLEDDDRTGNYGPDYWKDHALKGASVTFSATTEPSKDDEHFGFFKRPTKVTLLDGTEA